MKKRLFSFRLATFVVAVSLLSARLHAQYDTVWSEESIDEYAMSQSDSIQQEYLESPIDQNEIDREDWKNSTDNLDYADRRRNDSIQQEYLNEPIDTTSIDRKAWKEEVDGLDYTDRREKPKPAEAKKQRRSFTFSPIDFTSFQQMIWILVFVAVFAILILLLLRALGINVFPGKKKKDDLAVSIENFSDAVSETELERWLREALERSDYRLAIRIYYLMVIKELSDRKWITWKKDKTN